MSSKQRVLQNYPRAYITFQIGIWKVISDNRTMGVGATENEAWNDAASKWCC